MKAIIYRPSASDPTSGEILTSFEGSQINLGANLAMHGAAGYVDVTTFNLPDDVFHALDSTHRVVGGDIFPIKETSDEQS